MDKDELIKYVNDKDFVIDILGETIHTAFRKICESKESSIIWHAINDLDEDEWRGVLEWAYEYGGIKKVCNRVKELEEEIRKYVTEIEVFEENIVEMREEIKKLKYKNAILQAASEGLSYG